MNHTLAFSICLIALANATIFFIRWARNPSERTIDFIVTFAVSIASTITAITLIALLWQVTADF